MWQFQCYNGQYWDLKSIKAMARTITKILLIAASSLWVLSSYSADLLQVFNQASISDPLIRSQLKASDASTAGAFSVLGTLLPQLSAVDTPEVGAVDYDGYRGDVRGNTLTLTATQVLFNLATFGTFLSSTETAAAARRTYDFQYQQFIVNVAKDYFNILDAEDQLEFANSEVTFLKQTLNQVKQRFNVGLGTLTEVKQALANYDTALASQIKAKNTLEDNNEILMESTGVMYTNLATLRSDFPFKLPMPQSIDAWVKIAIWHNNSLLASEHTTTAAWHTAIATTGAQLPNLSLEATYTKARFNDNAPSVISSSPTVDDKTVGVVFGWDIFSGTGLFAASLQAAHNYEAQKYTTENTYRTVMSSVRQDYLAVVSDVSQIKAYKQSVIASQIALTQFEARYKVGTVTLVDVLKQIQNLFEAKQNLATAEYQYITDSLQLKLDSGTLTAKDMANLNSWLVPSTTSTTSHVNHKKH